MNFLNRVSEYCIPDCTVKKDDFEREIIFLFPISPQKFASNIRVLWFRRSH
jgi:hypothetical protein